jgi:hypothetical protein
MTVEELVGSRVWIRTERFRNVSGVISSVERRAYLDDLRSSLVGSIFRISLTSGGFVEVPGTKIAKVECDGFRHLLE